MSYLCLTVYCILNCIVQHLNMTLYSSTIGEHMPERGGWNRLALGTSAFCNVTLSWCSRVLYTWAWLAGLVRSALDIYIMQCYTVLLCYVSVALGLIWGHWRVDWHWVHLHYAMSYCSGVVGLCTLGLDLGGQLVLGTSAFCNIILSWCSRALYTWALFRVIWGG